MREAAPPDYVLVGHITLDRMSAVASLRPHSPLEGVDWRLGGTAFYSAITANRLGRRVGAVTSCSPDLVEDPNLRPIDVVNKPSGASTTFGIDTGGIDTGRRRTLRLLDRASGLSLEDVPESWRSAPIVHLGPVVGEVPMTIASQLGSPRVCATAQGWLREARVGYAVRVDDDWRSILALPPPATVVLSIDDLTSERAGADAAESRARELADHFSLLVLTRGSDGCTVFVHGQPTHIPASPAREVDATGAGDVFAAAFFVRLSEIDDPIESARFASRVAARSVEDHGAAGIPVRDELG